MNLEHRAHDVITFLSRTTASLLPDPTETMSEYTPSEWDQSCWENRSETSLLSDITGFSAVNSVVQTPHQHPHPSGSVASSVVSEQRSRVNGGSRSERSPS